MTVIRNGHIIGLIPVLVCMQALEEEMIYFEDLLRMVLEAKLHIVCITIYGNT